MTWLIFGACFWALGWYVNVRLAALPKSRMTSLLVPIIFGITLLVIWESVVRGLQIQQVLLPAPSVIAACFAASTSILWQDWVQTVLKGMMSGYIIGCLAVLLPLQLRLRWIVSPSCNADCFLSETLQRRCQSSAWHQFW